jgi:GT2 family glycosyltransferase
MRLSVVVPTRDRPAMLGELLASLAAHLAPDDEVVVADSASTSDETRRTAGAHGVRYVRCERPGASRARNAGWTVATNEVVAFVDDDCVVREGWADRLRTVLADEQVGFVTGRVEAPAGYVARHLPVALVLGDEPRPIDAAARGTVGSSNNVAVRREALGAIGGFDERLGPATFFAAAEDIDLFDRLIAAGFCGRYDPGAVVWHTQWRTDGARLRVEYRYGKGMGGRLAKLARNDRQRARMLRRDALWHNGVRVIGHDVRRRYEYGAMLATARVVGTGVGLVAGRVLL